MSARAGAAAVEVFRSTSASGALAGAAVIELLRTHDAPGAHAGFTAIEALRGEDEIQEAVGARMWVWIGDRWERVS